MKFSVITVSYNAAETIEDTIRSVAAQDYPEVEYIVVDGGSTDGTVEIIGKFEAHISKFVSEKDRGLYDAINKGISMATGETIALLHADDFYLRRDVLSKYAEIFMTSDCDAAYSDLYYVDRNDTNRIKRKWKSGAYRPGSFLNGWMPPHPTFVVRRELYQRYGTFNTEFRTAADYELMLRFIHKQKIKLCYLPEFTVKMRSGGTSNVSLANRLKANAEDRKAWQINGCSPRFYTLFLKPLRKLGQFLG